MPVQFQVVELPSGHHLCKVRALNRGDANSEVTVYYQVSGPFAHSCPHGCVFYTLKTGGRTTVSGGSDPMLFKACWRLLCGFMLGVICPLEAITFKNCSCQWSGSFFNHSALLITQPLVQRDRTEVWLEVPTYSPVRTPGSKKTFVKRTVLKYDKSKHSQPTYNK